MPIGKQACELHAHCGEKRGAIDHELTAEFTNQQQSGDGATELATLPLPDKGGHRIRDEDMARIGGNQQSTADRAAGARRLPLRLRDQPRRRHSTTLLVWTSRRTAPSWSAFFCSASKAATSEPSA